MAGPIQTWPVEQRDIRLRMVRPTLSHSSGETAVMILGWASLVLTIIHIVKEVIEVKLRRWQFLSDPANWLEVLLFGSTLMFLVLVLYQEHHESVFNDWKWQSGAISVLLAWCNLLLYLKRFPIVGIYIIMFVQVLKNVVSVVLAFGCLFVGFGLAFYTLLNWQDGFDSAGHSILKTVTMTLGELDYGEMFSENFAKHAMKNEEISVVLFLIFIVVMPIVIVNLLVGLAVGDISDIQTTSDILMLRTQVLMIADLQEHVGWLKQRAEIGKVKVYPNEPGFLNRLSRKLKTYNPDPRKTAPVPTSAEASTYEKQEYQSVQDCQDSQLILKKVEEHEKRLADMCMFFKDKFKLVRDEIKSTRENQIEMQNNMKQLTVAIEGLRMDFGKQQGGQ